MNILPDFPNMTVNNNKITSFATNDYNCIAWAIEKNDVWCWPDIEGFCFWPIKNREVTQAAFVEMFTYFGYECCENYTLEEDYQKIVIYIKDGEPTHASRQLKNGKWTSKLGRDVDIEHDCPEVLNGPMYGIAAIVMRKNIVS